MSIYGSTFALDNEEHALTCSMYVPDLEFIDEEPDAVRLDLARACDCGGADREPYVYFGSHIVPTPEHLEHGGRLGLGTIPPHISPHGIAHDEEEETHWPFLRMSLSEDERTYGNPEDRSIGSATVLLHERQVRELVEHLTEWLERGVKW